MDLDWLIGKGLLTPLVSKDKRRQIKSKLSFESDRLRHRAEMNERVRAEKRDIEAERRNPIRVKDRKSTVDMPMINNYKNFPGMYGTGRVTGRELLSNKEAAKAAKKDTGFGSGPKKSAKEQQKWRDAHTVKPTSNSKAGLKAAARRRTIKA